MVQNNVDQKIAENIKSGNIVELEVWRDIKSLFTIFKTTKDAGELDHVAEVKIINKMIIQRKDSHNIYLNSGRIDLADRELAEINVLKTLIPQEPTENEIRLLVGDAVSNITNGDINIKVSMSDMKRVMDEIKIVHPNVNGSLVAKIFKSFC